MLFLLDGQIEIFFLQNISELTDEKKNYTAIVHNGNSMKIENIKMKNNEVELNEKNYNISALKPNQKPRFMRYEKAFEIACLMNRAYIENAPLRNGLGNIMFVTEKIEELFPDLAIDNPILFSNCMYAMYSS